MGNLDGVKLTHLNHAAMMVHTSNVKIISDPWFSGTAFNNGWSLMFGTPPQAYSLLASTDFIYISHEHPDHFSPKTLKSVPEETRQNINILYQSTKDKKVMRWCQENGFKFTEIAPKEWTNLGKNLRVMSGTVPFDDSYLLLEINGSYVLNTNDCVLTEKELKSITRYFPKLDVLLTQFSYANWSGNTHEKYKRERLAKEVLDRFALQLKVLDPSFVAPFASSSYFSASDNFYMNDSKNSISDAIAVAKQMNVQAICLSPLDTWEIGSTFSNENSIHIWNNFEPDQTSVESQSPINIDVLVATSKKLVKNVWSKNNRFILIALSNRRFGVIKPVVLYITDLGSRVEFSINRGIVVTETIDFDVALSSDSLLFLMANEFGIETLFINGRFQVGEAGLARLARAFGVLRLNNAGRNLKFRQLFDIKFIYTNSKRIIRYWLNNR